MSTKGIFAGGDVVTGPRSVVEAMASGREAACAIDNYLMGGLFKSREAGKRVPEKLSDEEIVTLKKRFASRDRVKMSELPADKRVKDFKEVEQGYSLEQAQSESERCLTTCIFCEICWKVCPAQAIYLDGRSQQASTAVI
jgi:ferredoxin